MKVKLYIITYKHPELLKTTLKGLSETDFFQHDNKSVFIVNNHSSFECDNLYGANVLNNTFRPDHSTGHLSRNYNEIFLHAIKDIRNPDCDLLIHLHNDTSFDPLWFSKLLKYHEKYSFITQSQGCGFCSYLPEAINEIGMWDERFCTIGYHEGDYFLRAIKYNGEKSSINDGNQKRSWNPIDEHIAWKNGNFTNEDHEKSFDNYSICRQMFEMKWGIRDVGWDRNTMLNIPDPKIPSYILYPYFEKHLKGLSKKYFQNIDAFGPPFYA